MPKNYQNPWQEKPDAVAVKQSALKLAQTIVGLDVAVLSNHKRKLLRDVVWIVTEANGKHNTRYVSAAVHSGQKPIHERAIPIEDLVQRMLERPDTISQVLDSAIACLVTETEHRLLPPKSAGEGWDRYRHAGIRVFDRLEGKWLY
jgi:hypothetical protein